MVKTNDNKADYQCSITTYHVYSDFDVPSCG